MELRAQHFHAFALLWRLCHRQWRIANGTAGNRRRYSQSDYPSDYVWSCYHSLTLEEWPAPALTIHTRVTVLGSLCRSSLTVSTVFDSQTPIYPRFFYMCWSDHSHIFLVPPHRTIHTSHVNVLFFLVRVKHHICTVFVL